MPVCKSVLPVGRVVVPHGHPLWERGDGSPCWSLQPLHPTGQRGPRPCSWVWLLPWDVQKMLSCAGSHSPPHSARMRIKEEQKGRDQGGIHRVTAGKNIRPSSTKILDVMRARKKSFCYFMGKEKQWTRRLLEGLKPVFIIFMVKRIWILMRFSWELILLLPTPPQQTCCNVLFLSYKYSSHQDQVKSI